ncbi:MAG: nucleoside triphosphate pyrophosphohydrolase [Pseudomonadota bacterium]
MRIENLLEIMARLRDPQSGCPWDVEQTFETIAPYTIEEAYEVADAVDRGDLSDLKDELGDLLLQVVFHARMAEEQSVFEFGDVVRSICDKLVRRHPHVFGDECHQGDADQQLTRWEDIKAAERAQTVEAGGALSGVAKALPALQRAQKLGKRAARVGFDWPNIDGVLAKVGEELAELAAAESGAERHEEFGDLLFSVAQVGRHFGIDAEEALRAANRKFVGRFEHMEKSHARLSELDPEALETAWETAKRAT